jgi:glycerate 2-kinase
VRVVVAPDKFKGSLTATGAAEAIARGFKAANAGYETILVPMADGGEGTVEAFLAGGAQERRACVRGPLGDPVEARYARSDDLAVIEMASASGLALIAKERYDPIRADTFGTGQLLCTAAREGARRCIVGVGGSATVDVGTGMLRALGAKFLDESGAEIQGPMDAYLRLARIDVRQLDERVGAMNIAVASDVENPLTGEDGAARVFGPQKGASPEEVAVLERAAVRIADITAQTLGRDLRGVAGAGAAGGLGFALAAFLGARVERGALLVGKERGLDRALQGAALCATGEGKIDMQTLEGKTVAGVAEMARDAHVRVVAFGGVVDPKAAAALRERGVETVETAHGIPLEEALRHAASLLEKAAKDYGTAARVARR